MACRTLPRVPGATNSHAQQRKWRQRSTDMYCGADKLCGRQYNSVLHGCIHRTHVLPTATNTTMTHDDWRQSQLSPTTSCLRQTLHTHTAQHIGHISPPAGCIIQWHTSNSATPGLLELYYKSCKAPVKSSPPTNQHPVFYRPDALPVAQPCQSTEGKISHSMDLFTPSSPGGLTTLSLTTNSSWLPRGRVVMPLISPLMPVPHV